MPNDNSPDALTQVIAKYLATQQALAKRGGPPTRAMRFQMARDNMKKARKAVKECSAVIKAAHAMHKAAYLNKAAKKDAKPEADDFDHEDAMRKLQKAYGEIQKISTYAKAASVQLKKAAGRKGQQGQETSDGNQFYEVPPGIKDMSVSSIATTGPGGGERGSEPPLVNLTQEFPGKAARRIADMYKGYISPQHAEALARAAAAEAQVDVLSKLPAAPSGGRKPYAFDVNKAFGNEFNDNTARSLMNGVDPNGLVSDNEQMRKQAVGRLIGNMIIGGHGRSIMDPNFHGTAGGSTH